MPPRIAHYAAVSSQVFAVFHGFTPLVQGLSLDEAFLDVTASAALGDGERIAREIRHLVRERTELTASVGVAPNKLVAKIASDLRKPDGLVVAEDGSVWVALAAGGKGVAVYDADGIERDFIEIPDPMCTSVCFGGSGLRDLYIVSGSEGTDSDRAGSVYRVATEVAGLPLGVASVSLG